MGRRRHLGRIGSAALLLAIGWAALTPLAAVADDDLCASPSGACGEQVPQQCLTAFGAGARAMKTQGDTALNCPERLSHYRECLILVVQQCETAEQPKVEDAPAAAPETCPRDIELRLWDAIKDSPDATLIRHFLDTCDKSAFAPIAAAKLKALEGGGAPAAGSGAGSAAAPTTDAVATCPGNFGARTADLVCQCPAGQNYGAVWGSGLYTADSSVCQAARHAGVIAAQGGRVTASPAPGQPSYQGTSRNGVSTSSWGAYQASFFFPDGPEGAAAAAAEPGVALCPPSFGGRVGTLECYCQPAAMRGAVWGSGIYTADSSICRAALHAGAAPAEGGLVRLRAEAGQPSYQGTSRNGVTTSPWDAYQASFVFDGAGAAPARRAAALVGVCPADLRHLRGQSAAITCDCPAGAVAGRVWGDGVYTDDSSVCRAALHAGRIEAGAGGRVRIELAPGRSSYAGATRNGVETQSYGAWGGSFRFTES